MTEKIWEYAEQSITSIHKTVEVSMAKRIYFETEETITKKSKGWIEVEEDFTQVYNQFWRLAARTKSIITVKLLFWLLSHEANKMNGMSSGKLVFEKFNKGLAEEGIDAIAVRTFHASFDELIKLGALTRVGKGQYYFNPYVFWKDGKKDREDFLKAEAMEKKYLSKNPLPKQLPDTTK